MEIKLILENVSEEATPKEKECLGYQAFSVPSRNNDPLLFFIKIDEKGLLLENFQGGKLFIPYSEMIIEGESIFFSVNSDGKYISLGVLQIINLDAFQQVEPGQTLYASDIQKKNFLFSLESMN